METLFDATDYQRVLQRVESLQPNATRQWGKMSVAQMMEHTARALDMATGTKPVRQLPLGKLIGWMFRRDFLGPKPFGKNSPTGPAFIIHDEPDFQRTKERLVTLVREFHALGALGCEGHVHGFFGKLTGAEWGITQYKHIDHHLRQFGA